MNINYLTQFSVKTFLCIVLSSIVWSNFIPKSLAQTTGSKDYHKTTFVPSAKQPKPPEKGTPESNEGAGSRGDCPYNAKTLPPTSLVGSNNLTTTLSGHPSFWVYIPYSAKSVRTAEFTLQDENQDLYRDRVKLPANTPGIIEIKLPSTVSPIKIGQQYRWYFEISCSEVAKDKNENSSPSDLLTGVVKRIAPSSRLNNDLKIAQTPLERVEVFSKNGIWHETLTQLAQLRQAEPQNHSHKKLWNNILSQSNVGLAKVAGELILGIVEFQTSSEKR